MKNQPATTTTLEQSFTDELQLYKVLYHEMQTAGGF